MKKFMKSVLSLCLVVAIAMSGAPVSAHCVSHDNCATATTAAVATTPTTPTVPATPLVPATPIIKKPVKINKITCLADGKIDILFQRTVVYSGDLKVTVTDADKKAVAATVISKNCKRMKVQLTGLVKDKKYTVAITGIKVKGEKAFTSVCKCFVPKSLKTKIKVCKFRNRFRACKCLGLTVKCNQKVYLKDATVTVKDAAGNTLKAKLIKRCNKNIYIRVYGLKRKTTYTVTITGIKTKSESNYGSVTTTFKTK